MRSKLSFLGLSLLIGLGTGTAQAATCSFGGSVVFTKASYVTGQQLVVQVVPPATQSSRICLYDGNGNLVQGSNVIPAVAVPNAFLTYNVPNDAASAGTYSAALQLGTDSCAASPAADACAAAAAVNADPALDWHCNPATNQAEKSGQASQSCTGLCPAGMGGCDLSSCQSGGATGCTDAKTACVCTQASTNDGDDTGNTDETGDTGDSNTGAMPRYSNPLAGTIDDIFGAGKTTIQALLGLIGVIALICLVIAGLVYVTSAGSEEKIKTAKNIITYTIVGLGIALLAYSLLTTLLEII